MAANDAALRMRPERCRFMYGMTAWQTRNVPVRFVSILADQPSGVWRSIVPVTLTPALLTRMSIRPHVRSAKAASSATRAALRTSQRKVAPERPAASSSAPSVSRPSGSLSAATTNTPSRAKVSAISRPMPRPAPVTIAVLPDRSICMSVGPGAARTRFRLGAILLARGRRILAAEGRRVAERNREVGRRHHEDAAADPAPLQVRGGREHVERFRELARRDAAPYAELQAVRYRLIDQDGHVRLLAE